MDTLIQKLVSEMLKTSKFPGYLTDMSALKEATLATLVTTNENQELSCTLQMATIDVHVKDQTKKKPPLVFLVLDNKNK